MIATVDGVQRAIMAGAAADEADRRANRTHAESPEYQITGAIYIALATGYAHCVADVLDLATKHKSIGDLADAVRGLLPP